LNSRKSLNEAMGMFLLLGRFFLRGTEATSLDSARARRDKEEEEREEVEVEVEVLEEAEEELRETSLKSIYITKESSQTPPKEQE
jgi:hypothetical protein